MTKKIANLKSILTNLSSYCIILVFLFGCAIKNKQNTQENVFQSIIESTLQNHPDAIGIMVHVEAPEQSISWSGAAGHSNWDKTDNIEWDQPALIASSTKNYVAVSILRLVEQGKINLNDPIDKILTEQTRSLMQLYNFDLNTITIAQLLSHKSGIPDYTGTEEYLNKLVSNPKYRWTRDEQINLAIIQGPTAPPSTTFLYTDTNYLLLSEIIEQVTGLIFYEAIRKLVDYNTFDLQQTWFSSLEAVPENTKPLINQYVPKNNEHSYAIDQSFDLYGGGGLAATTKDLGKYAYHVFQGNVFDHKETLNLMFTEVEASENDSVNTVPCNYLLGIQQCDFNGLASYLHAGYWGTTFRYFPTLKASIVVFVVNESEFSAVEQDVLNQFIAELH